MEELRTDVVFEALQLLDQDGLVGAEVIGGLFDGMSWRSGSGGVADPGVSGALCEEFAVITGLGCDLPEAFAALEVFAFEEAASEPGAGLWPSSPVLAAGSLRDLLPDVVDGRAEFVCDSAEGQIVDDGELVDGFQVDVSWIGAGQLQMAAAFGRWLPGQGLIDARLMQDGGGMAGECIAADDQGSVRDSHLRRLRRSRRRALRKSRR